MFPKRFNFVLNYIRIEFFVTSRLREKNKTYVLFITKKKPTVFYVWLMNTCLQKQTRMHLYMDFNLPVLFSIGLSRSQSTFSNMLQEDKNILNIMYFLVICRVRLKYRHTWLTLVLVWFGFGFSDSCSSCQNGHVATCRLESGFSIFLRQ